MSAVSVVMAKKRYVEGCEQPGCLGVFEDAGEALRFSAAHPGSWVESAHLHTVGACSCDGRKWPVGRRP